ncbi:hypothetical protein JL722_15257 [Aureococcus anophagefferens]|nr:hypothetical protein JL722_15257 [Aureococcus anophagefferens]
MKAVALCCHESLTQLDVSRCARLNAESCGWLSGTLGYGQPSCRNLQSLDISGCARMTDDALKSLGVGCRRLRFLGIAACKDVTDKGVALLASRHDRAVLRSKTKQVIKWQAAYRGWIARKHDPNSVLPALRRLRAHHARERRRKGAARIRRWAGAIARRRTAVLRQVRSRVRNDELVAAFHMQNVLRILLARRAVTRKRVARGRLEELMEHAARRIVSFFRMVFGKSLADRLRAELARLRATEIERVWRGSRIMHWKHLRMNRVAGAARPPRLRAIRSAGVEERYAAWMRALTKDSCSDSDGGFGDLDHAWVERITHGESTWYNTKSGESADDDPRNDPVINELLGCSVRVYWPMMDEWYEGTLAKYHRRKKRFRVEYHDGDHEWLNLDANMERLQLFDANGDWAEMQYARRPALDARLARRQDRLDLKRKAAELEGRRAWEIIAEPEKDDMESYDEAEVAKPLTERRRRPKRRSGSTG